jgi:hypothetical protein
MKDHSAAFRLFSAAVWNWDEVCRLLIIEIVTYLIPGSEVWIVVDDTLCHKRGARVAFGGVFLDAVLSSKKHKIFRYGNNWVTLGIVVRLPFREDRYYCLNVLWRVCEKRGDKSRSQHRTKSQLAAEMVKLLAGWLPKRKLRVVADSAYVGKFLLKDRPRDVDIVGPIPWDAELTEPLLKPAHRRRKRGARLPSPQAILEGNDPRWPFEEVRMVCPDGTEKVVEAKVLRDICWYPSAGSDRLMIVLLRDPSGKWRNEALVSTDASMTPLEVIAGYCRRWSVEVAYADSKGLLGFHDPEVWCENSVRRAHPGKMWPFRNGSAHGIDTSPKSPSAICWRRAVTICGGTGSRGRSRRRSDSSEPSGCWNIWPLRPDTRPGQAKDRKNAPSRKASRLTPRP